MSHGACGKAEAPLTIWIGDLNVPAYHSGMEISLAPELEARLTRIASEAGKAANQLVQNWSQITWGRTNGLSEKAKGLVSLDSEHGFRDASTALGGPLVLPASLSTTKNDVCLAERSGEESVAILSAESKHPCFHSAAFCSATFTGSDSMRVFLQRFDSGLRVPGRRTYAAGKIVGVLRLRRAESRGFAQGDNW